MTRRCHPERALAEARTVRDLHLLVPGDIATLTGGYEYARRMLAGLTALGLAPCLHALDEGFPFPARAALAHAATVLDGLDDGACVVVDGLALGAMPDQACAEAGRLRLIGLVHHPLALETGLDAMQAARLRQSELQALRCMSRIIVTSAPTASLLREWGLERDIRVVEPGAAVMAYGGHDGTRLLQPGYVPRLLCVATVVPRKGHDVLLQALMALRDLPWHLDCVGSLARDADAAARLAADIAAAGLDERVTLYGERSPADLAALQQAADLFVLPTRYEGYGMAVAEAVALGLPVVATRTGAIPQLVGSGCGLLVDPGDTAGLQRALHGLLSDLRCLRELGRQARARRAPARSWADAAKEFAAAVAP